MFFLTILLLSVILVNSASLATAKPEEVRDLEEELSDILQANENSKRDNANLNLGIEKASSMCNKTLSKLEKNLTSLFVEIENYSPILREKLVKILNEELIYESLEDKLRNLYKDLEVIDFMHRIIYEDLQILFQRRQNGTHLKCKIIGKLLENSSSQPNELSVRSDHHHHHRSKYHHQTVVLQSKLNLAKLLQHKLRLENDRLMLKRDSDVDMCVLKMNNFKQLVSEAEEVRKRSADTKEILKTDIQVSFTIKKSYHLEIRFGSQLLYAIKQSVGKLRNLKQLFSEDEYCYNSVMKWEL